MTERPHDCSGCFNDVDIGQSWIHRLNNKASLGDGIPRPLPGTATGNAERGRALLVERGNANCVLCHAFPDAALRVAGNVGPPLAGVGGRLSPAQLRLRIADIQRLNPNVAMPSYYRVDALDQVATEYRGKPILDAQQVEDLIAYLERLQ